MGQTKQGTICRIHRELLEVGVNMTGQEVKDWLKAISATQNQSIHKSSLPERKEALYMAMKALDKQTPKMLEYIADGYADGLLCYDYAKCPVCGHDFEYGINDWESNYCSDCGQRLDWSE